MEKLVGIFTQTGQLYIERFIKLIIVQKII